MAGGWGAAPGRGADGSRWVLFFMRVCHVINCLSVGGTERQLVRLVEARGAGVESAVVTLLDRDTLRGEVEAAGVRVRSLGLDSARPSPAALLRLGSILREERPDVVQSWLYYANAAATLARPLARGRWPLCWNVRQTLESMDDEPRGLRVAFRLNRWMSPRADALVSNSQRSIDDHRRLGFRPRRTEVIPNGIDVGAIAFGDAARLVARSRLGIPEGTLVVGIAGRTHPLKDHVGFLEAFARVAARSSRPVVAVMAGRGVDASNAEITSALARLGLTTLVHLLGERLDLAELYAALDCSVSSSILEAFPNVVAEAMAAGVPVVATDVGECRSVVGEFGRVVPARDPKALAEAIFAVLDMSAQERMASGARARSSVEDRFGVATMARHYERLWTELRASRGGDGR